jgi:hypothetical protein
VLLKITCVVALVLTTTLIHAGFTALVLEWFRSIERRHRSPRGGLTRGAAIGGLVLLMLVAGYLESALWAGFYVMAGALPTFPEALYFSLVTFTSLGYGDITLGEEWRLASALEAGTGVIMFGWTTAIIVAAANRLYFRHHDEMDA